MSTRLRIGMGEPYGIRITVLASADFDPTTPTGVVFKVTKPTLGDVSWTGAIESQSAASAVAVYQFSADGLDLNEAGNWHVWVQWTVPAQSPGPRTEVGIFRVATANQL